MFLFTGVPYASPPTKLLRLMPPVTSAHWNGIKEADRMSPACPQPMSQPSKYNLDYRNQTSEDCLYLNIYTPISGKSLFKNPLKLMNDLNLIVKFNLVLSKI